MEMANDQTEPGTELVKPEEPSETKVFEDLSTSSPKKNGKEKKSSPATPEKPFVNAPFEPNGMNKKRKSSVETSPENTAPSPKKKSLKSRQNNSCICNDNPDMDPRPPTEFMIECSACEVWYHGSCINITETQAESFDKFHCKNCVPMKGPSTKKPRTNNHRHNAYDTDKNCARKPTQCGTKRFLEELESRFFAPVDEILEEKLGREICLDSIMKSGFTKPILIRERTGLDIIIPEYGKFDYADVVNILGESRQVLAIDVPTQEDGVTLTLGEYLSYMQSPFPRETILNIISLEFSNTELSQKVQPPLVVRELSWADRFFNEGDDLPPESPYAKPEVQKYCLMSAKDSYTDFHIDFGGTSVWYHIFKGKKIFFLIAPTPNNLQKYEEWMRAEKHSERFLGDDARCYRLELTQGQTILMPSGWIHAVYTPEDSLVFGGNFLHNVNVETQLKVHKMEDRLRTPDRYRYPHFYTVCWHAFNEMVGTLSDYVDDNRKPVPEYLIKGCKCLYQEFQSWMGEDEAAKSKRHEIPETIICKSVMKQCGNCLKKLGEL